MDMLIETKYVRMIFQTSLTETKNGHVNKSCDAADVFAAILCTPCLQNDLIGKILRFRHAVAFPTHMAC